MVFQSDAFNSECRDIDNGNYLHLIHIEEIDAKLKKFIDQSIVSICEGSSDTDLDTIKQRLVTFLTPKRGTPTEMGAIAEFFTHLYLNDVGFKQEFLFWNLEEGSIKKGFDGYYSLSNEGWIYESKSGSASTKGITHGGKIKEAYNDIKDKVSGKAKNNPWQNAYNHASLIDVDCAEDLRKNLKQFANEYTKDVFHDIAMFNLIPGSTIFLEGHWSNMESDELEEEITTLVKTFKFKNIHVICVNKKSLRLFWDYLNS